MEISTKSNSEYFYAVTAKRKGNEFVSISQLVGSFLEELSKQLPKKQHCFITINTEKVLLKEVSNEGTDQQIISRAFPGQDHSQFYVDIFRSNTKSYVALCRKEYVHAILNQFDSQKIEVLGFRLGMSPIENIVTYLPDGAVYTSRHILEMQGANILEINPNNEDLEQNYQIEDIKIHSNYLISLGGLFSYITNAALSGDITKKNRELKDLQYHKTFFRKSLVAAIGLILLIALINVVVFSSYYNEVTALEEQAVLVSSQKQLYKEQVTAIGKKERVVQNILQSGSSKSTFYINRIVASQPETIRFIQIIYQPLEQSVRPDKPITYMEDYIFISGQSTDKERFGLWTGAMETFNWSREVIILKYAETSGKLSDFEIAIKLDNEAKN